jgi:NSS family neurotransmitter:Na+ symporter
MKFSKTGHILASAGAAIGVANLVIFPYRVHFFGGSAYVLAFVGFTLLMGIPLMILENALGKRSGTDAINAFRGEGDGPGWAWIGRLGIVTSILVASFYLVLAGWTLDYCWHYLTDYATLAATPAGPAFGAAVTTTDRALLFTGLFTAMVAVISSSGLNAGIERLSKIAMPLLGLLIVFLIVSLPLLRPEAVDYGNLLRFDWQVLFVPSEAGELGIIHALGQAFFSLGLGAASMLTFATHLDREENVLSNAPTIVHLDTVVALLGAILVVPLLGGVNGAIYDGPPMVFINLVEIFKSYGGAAQLVGLLFFVLLAIAILTSAVSLVEPALRALTTQRGWSRRRAGLLLGALVFALAVPVVISCSPSGPRWLTDFAGMGGGDPTMGYFNFLLEWFGSIALLIGTLLLCIYLLRRWTLEGLFEELEIGGHAVSAAQRRRLSLAYRFIIPIGILLLLLAKVVTLF